MPCKNHPPGRKKRQYCHNHYRLEHKCRQYIQTRRGKRYCNNIVQGRKIHHCDNCRTYNRNCSQCISAVIPSNKFCRRHRHLQAAANAQRNRIENNDDHRQNQAMLRGGLQSLYGAKRNRMIENDVDLNIDNNNNNDQQNQEKFSIKRSLLYGYYYIVRPCGYILYEAPLWKSEGVKRTIEIWNECFEGVPSYNRPDYNWCDRGCGVSYHLENSSPVEIRNLWQWTQWLIDRYHGGMSHKRSANVVNQYCEENCDVAKMTFDDSTKDDLMQRFPGIWTSEGESIANSEAAEHTMDRVGAFKSAVQGMRIESQRFFLFWMSMEMNEELTRKQYGKKRIEPVPDPYF